MKYKRLKLDTNVLQDNFCYENYGINDIIDYPKREKLFNFQIGTGYAYVSHTYLNGLVNYVKPRYLILAKIYSDDLKFEEILSKLSNITYQNWYNTDLGKLEDEIYLIGELDDSWVVFDSDLDCSDCMILRVPKSNCDFDKCKELLINIIRYRSNYEHKDGTYVELPLPRGWINF